MEITSLPKDLPEIYNLSNVNREFDKKRGKIAKGAGGGPDDDAAGGAVQLAPDESIANTVCIGI